MRIISGLISIPFALCSLVILSPPLFAQDDAISAGWEVPRTEHGHPDLQGNWGNMSLTPLERPVELGNKRSYTEAEVLRVQYARNAEYDTIASPLAADRAPPPAGVPLGQVTDANFNPERMLAVARIGGEYRTSLIIDPPNGRFPYRDDRDKDIREQWLSNGFRMFDGPEIRPANERCLAYPEHLPLIRPIGSSHTRYMQIVQTENYVILYGEYSTAIRIIKLDSEHPTNGYAKWLGDSIAHWDEDSLVIHTTNFKPAASSTFIRSTAALKITETLTPVSASELEYRYTITDPNIYTQPVTAEMQLSRLEEGEYLYESACHEGNYSLPGILAGARRQEMDRQ
ncbi:MAG: hypothetical protein O2971_13130 [Proteobacteria bacterium]|nr:hypothetical protein [Pseudomonadota bacterium]